MITRIWHGYTLKINADKYEALLKQEIFPGIEEKKIRGYKGITLLRKELENECEFTTLMFFESLENVQEFAGVDYAKAYVPDKAKQILSKYDAIATHCEVRYQRSYPLD